jgi:L-alanine-DL-glutamate epimerase-like enolase superfamily enzyme
VKVVNLTVHIHRSEPNPRPIRDALQTLPGAGSVSVLLKTDDGIEGRGNAFFGRIPGAMDALAAVVEHELKPLILGTDPAFVRATHREMLRQLEYHGAFGLTMFAIALIDTALWDIVGKARGVPCWQLWGAVHTRIPAYAMVGWLNYSDEEVQNICRQAVEQGFGGVKIKVGYPTLSEDVKRVQIVREAIGPDVDLMVDANQSLTTAEALRRGKAFEDLGCLWWEEPIPADDIDGYAELADKLAIPVATGENLYTVHDFARFLQREAVDIVQPDLRRAGGPTALLDIGAMAGAFRRPYASHGGDPVQLCVMACLANAMYLETGLRRPDSPHKFVDGYMELPQSPGFGW